MHWKAALGAAVAATLVAAPPPQAATHARVDCHTEKLTFLFWPKGHPAVPSVRFPSFPYAHVEIFKSASGRYPNANQIGLVVFDARGMTDGGFSQSCGKVAAIAVDARGATAQTSKPTALVCAFPAPAQLDYAKTGRSITLRALVPAAARARLGVSASLTHPRSVLRYDRRLCRPAAPPS